MKYSQIGFDMDAGKDPNRTVCNMETAREVIGEFIDGDSS